MAAWGSRCPDKADQRSNWRDANTERQRDCLNSRAMNADKKAEPRREGKKAPRANGTTEYMRCAYRILGPPHVAPLGD